MCQKKYMFHISYVYFLYKILETLQSFSQLLHKKLDNKLKLWELYYKKHICIIAACWFYAKTY